MEVVWVFALTMPLHLTLQHLDVEQQLPPPLQGKSHQEQVEHANVERQPFEPFYSRESLIV